MVSQFQNTHKLGCTGEDSSGTPDDPLVEASEVFDIPFDEVLDLYAI